MILDNEKAQRLQLTHDGWRTYWEEVKNYCRLTFLQRDPGSYYERQLQHAEQIATAAYAASRNIRDGVR